MTNDVIAKFLEPDHLSNNSLKIDFKTRNSIVGVFIKTNDYQDLKNKNFWRIVTEAHIDEWKGTKNPGLAKIFNGAEITKLTAIK